MLPMFRRLMILTSLFFSCSLLSGQLIEETTLPEPIQGNGQVKVDQRPLSPVKEISISGNFQVDILIEPTKTPDSDKLTLSADENIIEHIETSTTNGTLNIRYMPKESSENFHSYFLVENKIPPTIQLCLASLEKITLSGSTQVKVKNLNEKSLKVTTSGSSQLHLAGDVTALKVQSSGSSQVQALSLVVNQAQFNSSGSSLVRLNVTNNLAGVAAGSSLVELSGTPSSQNVETSGTSLLKKLA